MSVIYCQGVLHRVLSPDRDTAGIHAQEEQTPAHDVDDRAHAAACQVQSHHSSWG